MSECPLRNDEKVKSLWRAAAIILSVVFAPAALACVLMLLRN
jgi:hypothetical protein